MNSIQAHPSFLALDRLVLGKPEGEVVEHVRGCELCRAHLERLLSTAPLPQALRNLGGPSVWRRWLAQTTPKQLAFGGLAGACAAAAVVVMLPGGPGATPGTGSTEPPGYLAAKGLATVAVWVKHGDDVRLWDGAGAVTPGDRLQLEIEPGTHRWFALLAGEEGVRVAEGDLEPERRHLLPRSFVVDGAPGSETLVVVLAAERLDEETLDAAARGEEPATKAIRLVIPKDGGARE